MHKLPSQKELQELFKYNPKTGKLFWKKKIHYKTPIGKEVNSVSSTGHLRVSIKGVRFLVHRVIWKIYYGEFNESMLIDHQNGVVDDNRIKNLRLVSPKQNSRNLKKFSTNTSGHTGVVRHKSGKWQSQIKGVYLGLYKTKEEAFVARKKAERVYNFHKNHGRVVL